MGDRNDLNIEEAFAEDNTEREPIEKYTARTVQIGRASPELRAVAQEQS